jgi:DNA-binding CsgD family transcriptional regulator
MTRHHWDIAPLLEALYALEQPRQQWCEGVARAAAATFDRGAGVGMVLYELRGAQVRPEAFVGVNLPPGGLELGPDLHRRPEMQDALLYCYRDLVCATLTDQWPDVPDLLAEGRKAYARVGWRDQLFVNGANPSGHGCSLFVFSKIDIDLGIAERNTLTRVASHLASAYRLHRRLERAPETSCADAVLRVDGRVNHAEPCASSRETRESLSEAVKQREWARSRASTKGFQPPKAPSGSSLDARWTLLDQHEPSGSRYVVARANTPIDADMAPLTTRETQVVSLAERGRSNKEIAYELGLAHSTVRVLLGRAVAKFGVRTREGLLERFRGKGSDPSAEGRTPRAPTVR